MQCKNCNLSIFRIYLQCRKCTPHHFITSGKTLWILSVFERVSPKKLTLPCSENQLNFNEVNHWTCNTNYHYNICYTVLSCSIWRFLLWGSSLMWRPRIRRSDNRFSHCISFYKYRHVELNIKVKVVTSHTLSAVCLLRKQHSYCEFNVWWKCWQCAGV